MRAATLGNDDRRVKGTQMTDGGLDPAIAARLKRDPNGLIAAIAQQYDTGEVLMLGEDCAARRRSASMRLRWHRSTARDIPA